MNSDDFLSEPWISDRIPSEFQGIPVAEFRSEVVGSRIPTISDGRIRSEDVGTDRILSVSLKRPTKQFSMPALR